jgi:hypothetical protein
MSKMGLHDSFGYLKHKLWQKKNQESNCQFDSWPLKIENRPDLLMCRLRVTHCWKALDEGYNFNFDLTSIEILHKKLWGPKFTGVLKQNDIWVQAPWPGTKNTIRGKVVVSLVSPCLLVVCPCTKTVPIMH